MLLVQNLSYSSNYLDHRRILLIHEGSNVLHKGPRQPLTLNRDAHPFIAGLC
jgi:hypothetical protein